MSAESNMQYGVGAHDTPEDISNMASGHKANLSNPNTSQQSKKHSEAVLAGLGEGHGEVQMNKNVEAGLKGALSNPNTSDEKKEEIRNKLDM